MKRLLLNLFIILSLNSVVTKAQDKINIPNDPAVVTGKTSSGITYYLVNNSSGNGLADFYLLRKAGIVPDEPTYSEITSFLNSISLYETVCFPGGTLPSIIHHTGASLQESLISVTEQEYSLTGIRNIPTEAVPSACDSALLVLLNFSGGARILEENTDRDLEFHTNYRITEKSNTAEPCIRRRFLDNANPSGPSSACRHNQQLHDIPASDIRKYASGWSRPDIQAVIIIGDFNVNSVKNSLNILSSTLPRLRGPFTPATVNVPVSPGTETFISQTDRESDKATVSVHFLSTPIPLDRRGTQAVLVDDFLDSVLMELIRIRVRGALSGLSIPVYSFEVRYGDFLGLEQSDDMVCELQTAPGYEKEALSFLSGILEGVHSGVTASEYADACRSHLAIINHHKNGVEATSNDYYLKGCLRHFLLGYTLPSWNDIYRYAVRINSSFDWKQMNDYLAAFIDEDTHKLITVSSPDILSESELKAAYLTGRHLMKIPLLDNRKSASAQSPVPTSIPLKKASAEPITKSSIYSLPNGASVIFKKNNVRKGELVFEAFSPGGISLAGKGFRTLDKYINSIAELTLPACSDSSSIELIKSFTGSMSYLKGSCNIKDIEDFFSMIRECFSTSSIDKGEFSSLMRALTLRDVHSFNSPDLRFGMMASNYLLPAEDRLTISYEMAQEFINTCFSTAGDFTFLFCGDVPEDQFKALTERYLSSLPGRTGKRRVPSPGAFHIGKSDIVREASMEMDTPRHYLGLRLTTHRKYDLPGYLKSVIIARIIRQEVSEEMFRSGILVTGSDSVLTYPEECLSTDFRMVCPQETDRYEKTLSDILIRLASNGVPAERIISARNALSSSLSIAERSDNRFWTGILKDRFINGKDFYTLQNKTLSSITVTEINEELKKFINESRRITTRLSPEIIETPKTDEMEPADQNPFI